VRQTRCAFSGSLGVRYTAGVGGLGSGLRRDFGGGKQWAGVQEEELWKTLFGYEEGGLKRKGGKETTREKCVVAPTVIRSGGKEYGKRLEGWGESLEGGQGVLIPKREAVGEEYAELNGEKRSENIGNIQQDHRSTSNRIHTTRGAVS